MTPDTEQVWKMFRWCKNAQGKPILERGNNTLLGRFGRKRMGLRRVLGLRLEVVASAVTGAVLEEDRPTTEEEHQPCDENDHLVITKAPAGPDLQIIRKDREQRDDCTCHDQGDGHHPSAGR